MDTPAALVLLVALTAVVLLTVTFAAGLHVGRAPSGGPAGRELELLRGAVGALHVPVLVVGPDGRVVTASDEARRLGLVRAGYLAHPELRALAAPGSRSGARPAVGEPVALSLPRGPVGDGHVDVRVTPRPLGGRHVLLDIENRSEAMRVEDVRRDFVANVSHELKTPVGAISVLAETLEQAADDPDAVRRFSGRIRQECARLAVSSPTCSSCRGCRWSTGPPAATRCRSTTSSTGRWPRSRPGRRSTTSSSPAPRPPAGSCSGTRSC